MAEVNGKERTNYAKLDVVNQTIGHEDVFLKAKKLR